MVHGLPDGALSGKSTIVYALHDMAELAARLGSPVVWDRLGSVLYQTDFREGMGMFHSGYGGTDGGIALVTGYSRQGAYSVQLRAPDEADKAAHLQIALPFQDPSKVGFEFSFSVATGTSYIAIYAGWDDGVNEYRARVRYDHVNSKLQYSTAPLTWADWQLGVALREDIRPEHTMKLVMDMAKAEFVCLMVDADVYSMSGIEPYTVDSLFPPYWYFYIRHYGVVNLNPPIYIDSVIVTQNEV